MPQIKPVKDDIVSPEDAPLVEMEREPQVNEMLAGVRAAAGLRAFDGKHCIACGEPYSDKNIYSAAGWGEARISGFCERCFDADCAEPEDEPEEGMAFCPGCGGEVPEEELHRIDDMQNGVCEDCVP